MLAFTRGCSNKQDKKETLVLIFNDRRHTQTTVLGEKEGGFQSEVSDLEDQRLTASNILPSPTGLFLIQKYIWPFLR